MKYSAACFTSLHSVISQRLDFAPNCSENLTSWTVLKTRVTMHRRNTKLSSLEQICVWDYYAGSKINIYKCRCTSYRHSPGCYQCYELALNITSLVVTTRNARFKTLHFARKYTCMFLIIPTTCVLFPYTAYSDWSTKWSLWGTSWILYLMKINFSVQIFDYFWMDFVLKRNPLRSK